MENLFYVLYSNHLTDSQLMSQEGFSNINDNSFLESKNHYESEVVHACIGGSSKNIHLKKVKTLAVTF